MCPTWILILSVPVPCLFQVCFYGLHEGKDPVLCIKVASLTPHHQAYVHELYALMLFIREEYDVYGCGMAVCIWLDALWLEGIVSNQALQIDEGDPLHVHGAPPWHNADVLEVKGFIAGHYVPG